MSRLARVGRRKYLVVLLSAFSTLTALAREPLDLVPADSLLCWAGKPPPDLPAADAQPSALQTLLELGTRVAGQALDPETQLNVRMAEMLRLMLHYPHALALIDASAQPARTDTQARRVDRLRFVLVVQNGADTEPFLRIIQKAVNEQTNSGQASLAAAMAGTEQYQVLRDRRLPAWADIAWGQIGDCFVLTVGPEVWPAIAELATGTQAALSADPWYAVARGKRARTALVEIFVAVAAMQRRLDPFVDGRAEAFFGAWDAADLEQAHWAIGFDGRAMYCVAHFRRPEQTVRRVYADPERRDPRLLAAVPLDARYALFDVPVGTLLPQFFRSLLVFQPPKERANIERLWTEIQATHGFDAQRDLLDHLGRRVLLHDYPRHPLQLPLAFTTLIEIRTDPAAVRRTLAALAGAWQAAIQKAAADGYVAPISLHGDDDGVWYIRFALPGPGPQWLGLAGPAWIVTDRFLILSWSPVALREYLETVSEDVRGAPPSR